MVKNIKEKMYNMFQNITCSNCTSILSDSSLDRLEEQLHVLIKKNAELSVMMSVNRLNNLDKGDFTKVVFEAIDNLVWLKDIHGNYIEMNEQAKGELNHLQINDTYGVINDRDSLDKFLEIHTSDDMSFLVEDISLDKEVIKTGKKMVSIKTAKYLGKEVTVKFSKSPVQSKEGKIIAVLTICDVLQDNNK